MKIARYQFCLMVLVVTLLQACAIGLGPSQELTPLQDAIVVRDQIITAKNALVEARVAGKLSQKAFEDALVSANDADRIVQAQINDAHNGRVVKSEVDAASKQLDRAKAVLK